MNRIPPLPITSLILLLLLPALAFLLAMSHFPVAWAQTDYDPITGLTVGPGDNPGELSITWDAHPDGPNDYRVSWAPEGENFRTFSDTDWNAFPTGTSHTVTGLDAGANYKAKVLARFQGGKSPWSAVVVGSAGAASDNTAPEFSSTGETRSLDETVGDATVGTAASIGAALPAATDADADGVTYTLGGTDAGKFGLDAANRQLQSKAGERYDHEAQASYSLELIASDGNGGTATLGVTVNVADRDEPPLTPAAPSVAATSDTNDSLDVSWDAPVNTGRPAIAGYDLRYRGCPTAHGPMAPRTVREALRPSED